jgi:hypothetical protein
VAKEAAKGWKGGMEVIDANRSNSGGQKEESEEGEYHEEGIAV